ncbi:hypothetical protein LEMLEM_LOCUS19120 [Lemmus lemmus]
MLGTVGYVFNSSIREAGAGGSLVWVVSKE